MTLEGVGITQPPKIAAKLRELAAKVEARNK